MKTRRIVLCLLALLTLSFLFASCAPADPLGDKDLTETAKQLTFPDTSYDVIYNGKKVSEERAVKNFVSSLNAKTGQSYSLAQYQEGDAISKSIVVGTVTASEGYDEIKAEVDRFGSDSLGSFAIVVQETNLLIVSYDSLSLEAALGYFVDTYAKADTVLGLDDELAEYVMFDKNTYFREGKIIPVTASALAVSADLSALTVGGTLLADFDADTLAYTVTDVPYATRYPRITAVPVFEEATVLITQATDANGGVATVHVTSRDADPETGEKVEKTYTVTFTTKDTAQTEASVVWKDGAAGIVTFVLDDGNHATADFVREEMLHKYSALRVSYALITNRLATIKTTDDKSEYAKTSDGKYIYTVNAEEVAYWQTHLAANNYCDLLSHSWTHDKWGKNDDGGEQELTDYSGNKTGTKEFPKGHITMELAASKQLLVDLFGQTGQYFVKPGTGMKEYDFYLDLLTGGTIYEGARSTNKALNDPDSMGDFLNINSWMVTATETPDQWNAFIDQAVAEGKWATFCIHNIVSDYAKDPSGHYIFQKNADAMFAHANALAASGDLWIATMTEAANYIRLRNATTVTAETYREDRVTLNVSTTLEGEHFDDIDLTVKVAVPNGWSGTVTVSNGMTAEVETDANGACFVYLNLRPTTAGAQYVLTQA